jgi:hypothetical protein
VLEILLSDPRVDGTGAIPNARRCAVHVLLEDERCGNNVNRELFLQHHKKEVAIHDELVKDTTARICAVSWVMKMIGNGWGDLREPTEERMAKQPVNWEGKRKKRFCLIMHAARARHHPALQASTKQLRFSARIVFSCPEQKRGLLRRG